MVFCDARYRGTAERNTGSVWNAGLRGCDGGEGVAGKDMALLDQLLCAAFGRAIRTVRFICSDGAVEESVTARRAISSPPFW